MKGHLDRRGVRGVIIITASVALNLASLGVASAGTVIHRQVTFTLDAATFTTDASGTFMTYNSGPSAPFVPVRPENGDRLLLHVKFVDADGKPQYLILRNVGTGYLNPDGWQRFQATLGLSAGLASGGYTNGWVFTDAFPGAPGNFVTSTTAVSGASEMPSPGLAGNYGGGSIALHELRVEFNFNTSYAPVITDGGGLDKLTLDLRAERLTVLSPPAVQFQAGPLRADGTRFDFDADGVPDTGTIGIGLTESQHYRYQLGFGRVGGGVGAGEFALMDALPAGFAFDIDAEKAATNCSDGVCDGVAYAVGGACSATVSGPIVKRKAVDPRYVVMEGTEFFVGEVCIWDIFVKTVSSGSKGKVPAVFEPTSCQTATGATTITREIALNEGILLFDKQANASLGTITRRGQTMSNPIWLTPVGCR